MSCCNDVAGDRLCAVETVTISCVPAVEHTPYCNSPYNPYSYHTQHYDNDCIAANLHIFVCFAKFLIIY